MIDVMRWGPLKRMFYERKFREFLGYIEGKPVAVVPTEEAGPGEELYLAWSLREDFAEMGKGSLAIRYRYFDTRIDRYTNGRGVLAVSVSLSEACGLATKRGIPKLVYSDERGVSLVNTADGTLITDAEDLEIMGLFEEAVDYSLTKGPRFALDGSHGTGCRGYLGKNIHFKRDGNVIIPNVRLPRLVKDRLKNFEPSHVSSSVNIPGRYYDLWNIDERNILESSHKYSGEKFEKFAYNPRTAEFLIVSPGQHHKYEVVDSGSSPLDEYVRGIVLRLYRGIPRTVSFRPCFPRGDLERLREEIDNEKELRTAINLLSFDLQYSTMGTLRGLGGKRWSYQFNVDNRLLEEQTGVPVSEW